MELLARDRLMATSFMITGKNGQLGRCLVDRLGRSQDWELLAAYDHSELDIADSAAVSGLFRDLSGGPPDVLINAAAYTAVDLCESEVEACTAVNGAGPGLLAEACREAGVGLAHVSTDYVFDGQSSTPYRETDATAPRTAYGCSKLEGERRVLAVSDRFWVIRTSWVFGPGKNFVAAILRQAILRELGKVSGPLRVVDDQLGCPTYSADLADAILALSSGTSCNGGEESERDGLSRNEAGLLHLSNAAPCTWWEFARAILDATGYGHLEIERGTTAELNTAAVRPPYSVLDGSRAQSLGIALRPWQEALTDYLGSDYGAELRRDARSAAEAT